MKKRYGIVFPSECFNTKEAALKYARDMLIEDEISAGLYVFEASNMVHLKTKKDVVEVAVAEEKNTSNRPTRKKAVAVDDEPHHHRISHPSPGVTMHRCV